MSSPFETDYRLRGRRWAGGSSLPPVHAGDCVLETGCGNGSTLHPLLALGCRAVGIDIAQEAVRMAGPRDAVAGDIRCLPFRDGVFDAVICRHVLGHLNEAGRSAGAAELLRVTRPGGVIYFSGFSPADFRCGSGTETEPNSYLKGDGIMTHYFTEDELRACFSSAAEIAVTEKTWSLRVRGIAYPRSELSAVIVRGA